MSYLSYTQDYNDNLLMLLVRDHKRYEPIVKFFDSMTRELSELSWGEAELIAFELSKKNRSKFCTGIRRGMVNALKQDVAVMNDRKFTVVLQFALKVNENPQLILQGDVDKVVHSGWSEQTVEDIVGLVAIQKAYSTIATGLGFKKLPEVIFSEIGIDTVKSGSYEASFRKFIEN